MIAYLDCSTGVSGDKLLGALLDVGTQTGSFTGADLEAVVAKLAPEARLEFAPVISHGVAAVGVCVTVSHDPPSRHLPDIEAILDGAGLPDRVRDDARRVFAMLAQSEARVHGTSVEQVHFHEVGATDSIVDIVGVLSGLHALGISALTASPLALGSGSVETSHGVLAVPAPATALLVVGLPVYGGPLPGELTTPTGAALVATIAASFGASPAMTPRHVGHGAGTRDIGAPNVCRLTLGEAEEVHPVTVEDVVLLETNIDHISPEEASDAARQLLDEGCLDVWITPIVMKKGRSAMQLSALVAREYRERFAQRIVALTGTLGVRTIDVERFVAERGSVVVPSPYGPVHLKSGAGRMRPEHDDVARIARERGLTYREVADELGRLTPPSSDRPQT